MIMKWLNNNNNRLSIEILLDSSHDDLGEWVDELFERVVSGRHRGQEFAPQRQTVHKLPIVDGLERLAFAHVHGIAQVNRQLTNVHEHVLVGQLGAAGIDLDQRALHEVYRRQCVHRCEFRVARERQVQRL